MRVAAGMCERVSAGEGSVSTPPFPMRARAFCVAGDTHFTQPGNVKGAFTPPEPPKVYLLIHSLVTVTVQGSRQQQQLFVAPCRRVTPTSSTRCLPPAPTILDRPTIVMRAVTHW